MCGVPIHRADEYLQRLIRQGYRVAVCEQLEDPAEAKKRGSKSVVKRAVVRLVTPGTLTEDALLDPRRANRLLALARVMERDPDMTDRLEFAVAGIAFFAGAWLWGLLTAWQVLRRERAEDAAQRRGLLHRRERRHDRHAARHPHLR